MVNSHLSRRKKLAKSTIAVSADPLPLSEGVASKTKHHPRCAKRAKSRSLTQCLAFKYLLMRARYSKPSKTGLDIKVHAYLHIAFFHAVTSERKDLSKIHEFKGEKSLE